MPGALARSSLVHEGNQALRSRDVSAIAFAERLDQSAFLDVDAIEKSEKDRQKGRACFQLAQEKPQAGGLRYYIAIGALIAGCGS
jgi:hypothetical protein